VIWRVRDRATFEALRRQGRRVRRGPVTVVHVPAEQLPVVGPTAHGARRPQSHVRAAFAVSRKVGHAVVRNRLRRRLRAIVHELERGAVDDGTTGLAPGAYLLTVRPEARALSYDDLRGDVTSACAALGVIDGEPNRGPA
jgi:ribonuclease P protein component